MTSCGVCFAAYWFVSHSIVCVGSYDMLAAMVHNALAVWHVAYTFTAEGFLTMLVKFQAKVIVLPSAILKYDVCVCGGWVMVKPPAGADCGMLTEVVEACDEPP